MLGRDCIKTYSYYLFILFSIAYIQAEWTEVIIPYNQNIDKLISDGNDLYGFTSAASIYFSPDNGLSWESLPIHPDMMPYGVNLFKKVDNYLFFNQHIGSGSPAYNYRTYYNGEFWEEWERFPFDENIIYEFVHSDHAIYALLSQGISVSYDYGSSWELIDAPEISGYIHLQFADSQYLYVNHGCNLYRYNIVTQQWTDITGVLDDIGPPEPYSCTSISQIEKFNGKLIISMYWYGGVGTLFYSENHGDSWEVISSFPSTSNSGYGSNNISAMAVKSGILYAGTASSQDGIFYTHNLIEWMEYSVGLSSYNLSVSALASTEEKIYKLGGTVNLFQNDLAGALGDVNGCTDPEACNYNPDATQNDGSCEYYNPEIMCDCAGSFLDINGDCCSELMMDTCWVCNGDGPTEHYDCDGNCLVELDCAGNCCVLGEEGCYWQETGPCGEPGPSNGMDECGVCGGDNSSCMTCAGVPCSDAYMDNCGVCDDVPENDCVQGCDDMWGSGFELDECGVCDGDGSSCADSDNDGCLDNVDDAPYEWDDDYDMDGLPDDCDADDDNDGAVDYADSDDNSEFVCSDVDGDTCDDCSSGSFDPANDGPDYNENGICDDGDINDTDGDGVIDDEDSDPFNPYQCADNDGDECDDCGTGYYNPADDGADYDADGICDFGDLDDDNDGTIDSEDCAPLYELAAEVDCCGVCGGDNSSCSNCCGIPFNDDCTSDCYIDYNTGDCCYIEEVDECGICYGDNACLGCEAPFIDMDGHCLHEDDIAVLQAFIDNSVNSDYMINNCSDSSDPWCQSPNLYMDQSTNWFGVLIDGTNYTFSNDNGVVEPLELGLQEWQNGRLTSIMCGAYIYCQLSGEIPSSISDLTEINVLRLEVNYFTGYIPESICGFDHLNYEDYLAFDLSYNKLCPPYPDCVPDGAVDYMDTSECGLTGDVNNDNQINVLDIVMIVDFILSDIYNDTGDINGDNTINVIDIVILIDMILNSE